MPVAFEARVEDFRALKYGEEHAGDAGVSGCGRFWFLDVEKHNNFRFEFSSSKPTAKVQHFPIPQKKICGDKILFLSLQNKIDNLCRQY
jgi:hypothetical protein